MPPRRPSVALGAKYSALAVSPHDVARSQARNRSVILLCFFSASPCRRMTAISCKTIISAMRRTLFIIPRRGAIMKTRIGSKR